MENQNQLQVFSFEGKNVRTVIINNEPWWVAKDVAESLGYKNASDAINRHCKGVAKHDTVYTNGGLQNVRIIAEPDLYRLIVGSNLPEAIRFESWVFETVLPSIRKTGSYSITQDSYMINDPIKRAERWIVEEKVRQQLLLTNKSLEEKIEADKPKVTFANVASVAKNSIDINSLSKIISNVDKNCGQKKLFTFLREQGLLMSNNTPYERYKHYFTVTEYYITKSNKVVLNTMTKVKPNGQQYIIDLWIKKHDIKPKDTFDIEDM